jgi:hypothetical protein
MSCSEVVWIPAGARAEEIVQAYDKWWPKSRRIPRGIRRTERMQEAAFKLSERLWCPLAQTGTEGGLEVSPGEQKKKAAPLAGATTDAADKASGRGLLRVTSPQSTPRIAPGYARPPRRG